MAGKCNRCGRLGAVMGRGICPDCLRAEAEEKRNRILENQALQEQKAREEQARRERERDEQERRSREEQQRQDQERYRQEREDRRRQLEKENQLQEERLRLEQERIEAEQRRYEEEKREREWKEEMARLEEERLEQERAWDERCAFMDNLSDAEMKDFFELSSNGEEREYLKDRYRKSISSNDYLDLIKNEKKYITRKRIQNYIATHSEKESVDVLLYMDSMWYEELVEKEFLKNFILEKDPLLKDFLEGKWLDNCNGENEIKSFGDVAIEYCKMLYENYGKADSPEKRQVYLRMIVTYLRFLDMPPVEKQIFFREYVSEKMKGEVYNPNGYETENGILFSMMLPLFLDSLDPAEQEKYAKLIKQVENACRANEEERIQKKELLIAEQNELDQKWQENEKIVDECNAIGNSIDKISKQIDEINQIGKKYLSQIKWSILVIGCFSLTFTRVTAIMLIVLFMLVIFSIKLFVKRHIFIGILSSLSLLSFLITIGILGNEEATMNSRIAGLLIAGCPLIVLGIFAVKRIVDVKRLNSEVQKKNIEDGEKRGKHNALAEKNAELVKEIEMLRKEIDRLRAEIDSPKNGNPKIQEMLNMN